MQVELFFSSLRMAFPQHLYPAAETASTTSPAVKQDWKVPDLCSCRELMTHTYAGAQGAIKSNFNVLAHALQDHAAAAALKT